MTRIVQRNIVFPLLMSLIMSFLMGAWVTFINLGPVSGFFESWLKAFLLAWPAAFMSVLLLAARVEKVTNAIVVKFGKRPIIHNE